MSLPNPSSSARDAVPADQLILEVVAGRHAGVCVPLDGAGFSVGSGHDADVLLRDPGVAPTHVRLRLDRSLLSIEAEGGDVGVGNEVLPLGHGCRVRLPADLALGEARLCISRPASVAIPDASFGVFVRELMDAIGLRRGAAAIVLVVSLLALSVMAYPHGGGEVAAPTPAAPGALAPGAAVPLDLAMGELTTRIDAARLRNLHVSIRDGSLLVSGQLARREHEAWKAIERWFDQSYGGRPALATNVTVNEGRVLPPPQLQALWFGVRPYIITANGARHEPGSVLDNGWIVTEIGEGRLVLSRDGEMKTLTYP